MSDHAVSIEFTEEERLNAEFWAERKQKSLDHFVREAVRQAMPGNIGQIRVTDAARAEIIERVHELADEADTAEDAGEEPPAPDPAGPPGTPKVEPLAEAPNPQPPAPKRRFLPHSCHHCDRSSKPAAFPSCEGTCRSPSQMGAPCRFPSSVAIECEFYVPTRSR